MEWGKFPGVNGRVEYFIIGKLFRKRLGQMELDDGKLPEAKGERLIHNLFRIRWDN
jgi:hypothetical protein